MDYFTEIAITLSYAVYEVYAIIARLFARTFPKLTEYSIKLIFKKMFDNEINGPKPTDIQVKKPEKFYPRLVAYLNYGMCMSYINEECTCEDLTGAATLAFPNRNIWYFAHPLRHILTLFNLQTRKRAWIVGKHHYDVGNDVYDAFLDKNLQYTCGYWKNAKNLDEAEIAKMDLMAQKLHLKPGMRVLDIGCGWATLAYHFAKNYGVSVVGVTVSVEQIKYGKKKCEGLPVDIRLIDYRDLNEKFDRIISVGMFEHVGPKNYNTYFGVVDRCLKDDGLFLLHCYGNNNHKVPSFDVWIHDYIFPNGMIPSLIQIAQTRRDTFVIEDLQNIGYDYSLTFDAWEENWKKNWPTLKAKHSYDERFYRIWKLYFCTIGSMFRTRQFQIWQIVFSKNGVKNGYVSVR